MKLRLLRRTHADYDARTLELYRDLFAGGKQFRRNAGQYLIKHEAEPAAVFQTRVKGAHYLNYTARIANYFASWLFTSPMVVDDLSGEALPDFYTEFKEDCDGQGTDLDTFLRQRFIECLVSQCSYFRVAMPTQPDPAAPVMSRAEWEALGLDRAVLAPVPCERITNWERDESGGYLWVLEHESRESLPSIEADQPTVVESWTQWSADGSVKRWELRYRKGERPGMDQEVPEVAPPENPFGGIPLVCMEVPTEMWLLDNVADAQLEHFRKRNALSWAMDRSCYVTPLFKTKKQKGAPVLGAGYFIRIDREDDFTFPEVPSSPFETIATYVDELKDEIHRLADQMAEAASQKAAHAARSAQSKEADKTSTQIVLLAYAECVKEAAERMLDLVALGRGDDIEFSVSGMDNYRTVDEDRIVNTALTAQPLGIKSPTFQRELQKQVTRAILQDASEETRRRVEEEIDANLSDEEAVNPLLAEVNQKLDAGFDHPADVQRANQEAALAKAKGAPDAKPAKGTAGPPRAPKTD